MRIPSLSPLPNRLNTLKRVQNDLEFRRIFSGKYGIPYQFRPCGKKTIGSAMGNLFEKVHTNPVRNSRPLKHWLGKVNFGTSENQLFSKFNKKVLIKEEQTLNSGTILEYIANNLYRLFSDSTFETPKMRLSRLPIMNEYLKEDVLAQYLSDDVEIETCIRIMCKWSNEYKDLAGLKVKHEDKIETFMSVIKNHGIVPKSVIDPENENHEVPFEGLMGVLACAKSLGDIDVLGVEGRNVGYVIERNEKSEKVDRIRIVKIDPGMAFTFKNSRENDLGNKKDILFCSNYSDRGIRWDLLSNEQKYEFLEVKMHHFEIMKDRRILQYIFSRDNKFEVSKTRANKIIDDLVKNLEIEREIYGKEIGEYQNARSNFLKTNGDLCMRLGDYDRSIICFEKLLVLPEMQKDYMNYFKCVFACSTIETKRGNIRRSQEYNQRSLRICTKHLSFDHSSMAQIYNTMGGNHFTLGEFRKAIECYRKSIDISKKGNELPYTTYNNLGLVYQSLAQFNLAIDYYLASLGIGEGKTMKDLRENLLTLPTEFGDTRRFASTFNNLGIVLEKIRLFDDALWCYGCCKTLRERILPSNHPDLGTLYDNMSIIYKEKGMFKKALELNSKCLRIYSKSLTPNHRDIGLCNYNRGLIYTGLGDYRKALDHTMKSLDIFKREKLHPHLGLIYAQLATCQNRLSHGKDTIYYQKKALEIQYKFYRPNDMRVGVSLNNLATYQALFGDIDDAIENFEKCIKIFQVHIPPTDPLYENAIMGLRMCKVRKGSSSQNHLFIRDNSNQFGNSMNPSSNDVYDPFGSSGMSNNPVTNFNPYAANVNSQSVKNENIKKKKMRPEKMKEKKSWEDEDEEEMLRKAISMSLANENSSERVRISKNDILKTGESRMTLKSFTFGNDRIVLGEEINFKLRNPFDNFEKKTLLNGKIVQILYRDDIGCQDVLKNGFCEFSPRKFERGLFLEIVVFRMGNRVVKEFVLAIPISNFKFQIL